MGHHLFPLCATLGREPPEAMSLTMQTRLRYAVNEPPPYSTAFFKCWFLCVMKNSRFFWQSGKRILLKFRVIYWLSWLKKHIRTHKVVHIRFILKLLTFLSRKENVWRNISENLVCFVVIFDLNNTFF